MNEPILPAAAQIGPAPVQARSTGSKLLITLCVLFGVFGLTAASAAFWYQYNFHASPFKPVAFDRGATDARREDGGARRQVQDPRRSAARPRNSKCRRPSDPSKTIVLNEREINAWLQQQGLGENFKFHIRKNGFAATILTPVEADTPLLGAFFAGHTVRVQVAFNTKLDENHHLALSLADVNVAGISLPNDWMGTIKGVNLLAQNDAGTEDLPS